MQAVGSVAGGRRGPRPQAAALPLRPTYPTQPPTPTCRHGDVAGAVQVQAVNLRRVARQRGRHHKLDHATGRLGRRPRLPCNLRVAAGGAAGPAALGQGGHDLGQPTLR